MSLDFDSNAIEQATLSGLSSVMVVDLSTFDMTRIDRAIVFYYALWSGPSVVAYEALCEALSECSQPPTLLLINADELNDCKKEIVAKAIELFGEKIGAWGEICWIKDGKVQARAILHWKESYEAEKNDATRSNIRRRPATKSDIKSFILRQTELLEN